MPFKHHAARRHRIARARYRVLDWPTHEAGLRRRGDLTLWIDQAALAGWAAPRRTTPGGQRRYSDLAVELVLTLRLVFHLALRQAEACTRSVLASDLLRQPERAIASLIADGAYDGDPVCQAAVSRQPGRPPDVVIPPRSSAVPSTADPNKQSPRDHPIQLMAQHGRVEWQHVTGYEKRNVAETTLARCKRLIGPRLHARSTLAQAGEVALATQVLNRMIRKARPVTARRR